MLDCLHALPRHWESVTITAVSHIGIGSILGSDWASPQANHVTKTIHRNTNLMALLDILVYPDPRLRRKALPVERVDDTIRELIRDMAETMYQAPGIGLAATQVNVSKRVMVIDHSDERNELQVFINPVIRSRRGEIETEEGCLSVPGIVAPVKRAEEITVTALDSEGQINEFTASGILAICLQHELDHLDGKVFVDYLSRLKRERIRKQLLKDSRDNNAAATTDRAVAL